MSWYWLTVIVVMLCSPAMGEALRTVTVPVVLTGVGAPPFIAYEDSLVPVPPERP